MEGYAGTHGWIFEVASSKNHLCNKTFSSTVISCKLLYSLATLYCCNDHVCYLDNQWECHTHTHTLTSMHLFSHTETAVHEDLLSCTEHRNRLSEPHTLSFFSWERPHFKAGLLCLTNGSTCSRIAPIAGKLPWSLTSKYIKGSAYQISYL